MSSGLPNGGPVAILWGLVVVTICNVCVALSMGELCSSMPTALGQAFWVSRLAAASSNAFMTELILAAKLMFDEDRDDDSKGWVQLLIYIGVTVLCTAVNHFGCRIEKFLPWFNRIMGVWYMAIFLMIGLALLISVGTNPDKHFQSAEFVFGRWINETGWPDGVTWFLGLVQAAYGLIAFDSVIHMVEEIPAPRRNGPKMMYMSVICGAVTGFVFMAICLSCIQSLDEVLTSPVGFPFSQIIQDAIGLHGASVLLSLFICNGMGQAVSVSTSASRLTWSFARDGGIPFSGFFWEVDPRWQAPTRALWLQAAVVSAIGAILSVSTIALTISYAMPIAVLLRVGRDKSPPGEFRLGKLAVGINVVSIVYCAITSVFFLFPSRPGPAVDEMNYAVAIFGVMMIIALGFWSVQGRTSYMFMEVEDAGKHSRAARQPMSEEGLIEPAM
ncbi:Choline transport protein [Escovopsis weberi]|uniref:Choline transport protein n=1 Tax=Escovopsis weberi TaxID=150374 RepID=A0A0N0RU50_ESCWE|nr:Choline transport protein [Escovopsis weberi]